MSAHRVADEQSYRLPIAAAAKLQQATIETGAPFFASPAGSPITAPFAFSQEGEL